MGDFWTRQSCFICFWFWCMYLFFRFLPWGRILLSHLFVYLHGIVNSCFMHYVSTLCSYVLVPDLPGVADRSPSSSLSTWDVSSQCFLMKDAPSASHTSCFSLRAGYLSKGCSSSVGRASFRMWGGMREDVFMGRSSSFSQCVTISLMILAFFFLFLFSSILLLISYHILVVEERWLTWSLIS